MRSISITVIAVAVLCLITAAPAFGVVMHDDNEPTDRPHNDVIGRWSSNGSCVAIAPNYIVTTRHQGGGVGTSVVIGGVSYTVAETWNHSSADIRVARLSGANLTNYVGLYEGTDEHLKNFVMGGFGEGRGDVLKTSGGVEYGYSWTGTGKSNETLRWGTNKIDALVSNFHVADYTSNTLRGDFDETGTDFEAAPAEYDSGGGWFIKVGGEWRLAALNAYVEHGGETWFRNSVTGNPDPDQFWGIRISSYDTWINNTIPEPGTMILLTLGAVSLLRRRRKA